MNQAEPVGTASTAALHLAVLVAQRLQPRHLPRRAVERRGNEAAHDADQDRRTGHPCQFPLGTGLPKPKARKKKTASRHVGR